MGGIKSASADWRDFFAAMRGLRENPLAIHLANSYRRGLLKRPLWRRYPLAWLGLVAGLPLSAAYILDVNATSHLLILAVLSAAYWACWFWAIGGAYDVIVRSCEALSPQHGNRGALDAGLLSGRLTNHEIVVGIIQAICRPVIGRVLTLAALSLVQNAFLFEIVHDRFRATQGPGYPDNWAELGALLQTNPLTLMNLVKAAQFMDDVKQLAYLELLGLPVAFVVSVGAVYLLALMFITLGRRTNARIFGPACGTAMCFVNVFCLINALHVVVAVPQTLNLLVTSQRNTAAFLKLKPLIPWFLPAAMLIIVLALGLQLLVGLVANRYRAIFGGLLVTIVFAWSTWCIVSVFTGRLALSTKIDFTHLLVLWVTWGITAITAAVNSQAFMPWGIANVSQAPPDLLNIELWRAPALVAVQLSMLFIAYRFALASLAKARRGQAT
ncbi:hypothetical protein JW859_05245 [bacterium]|nr:hypothetical protein [bacterium]